MATLINRIKTINGIRGIESVHDEELFDRVGALDDSTKSISDSITDYKIKNDKLMRKYRWVKHNRCGRKGRY